MTKQDQDYGARNHKMKKPLPVLPKKSGYIQISVYIHYITFKKLCQILLFYCPIALLLLLQS